MIIETIGVIIGILGAVGILANFVFIIFIKSNDEMNKSITAEEEAEDKIATGIRGRKF
jgi:hypothetical protein